MELEGSCFFQCCLVDFHRRTAFIEGNGTVFPKVGLRIDRRLRILVGQMGDVLREPLLIKRSIDGCTMPCEEDPPAIIPALKEPACPTKRHGFFYGFLVIADRKRLKRDLFVNIPLRE